MEKIINTIINDDSINILKQLPDKSVDLCLCDPPYGIGLEYDNYEDTEENWEQLISATLPEMIRVSKMVIMPCCRIAKLGWIYNNFPPDWLMVWYKGSTGHRAYIGFNDYEPHLVYGKSKSKLYMHDFFQTRPSPKKGSFDHPCPKPEEWAEWIISRATDPGNLVLDCFSGAGTVPVVAKKLGRNFIGVDISAKYCEIARKRLEEVNL